jgi:hypothetical protein
VNAIYIKEYLNLSIEEKGKCFTFIKIEKALPLTEQSEGEHSVIENLGSKHRRMRQ